MILLPSILTIFLCAFILGGTIQLLVLGYDYSNRVTDHFQLEVFLFDHHIDNAPIIGEELLRIGNIDSVTYISKESAKKLFIAQFGHEMIEDLDVNPLPSSFKIYPGGKLQNLINMKKLVYKLEKFSEVETVSSSLDTIELIEEWKSTFYFWSLVISIGLVVMLWLIISNSVRLTLFSREILVENMHYCGASESFIQFPFVVEGFFQGIAGAVFALSAWYGITWAFTFLFPEFASTLTISLSALPWVTVGIAILGGVTSFRVVHDYMKNAEAYNA